MHYIQLVILAVKNVFKEKIFLITFFALSILALWFFIYIPVRQIPGNTFSFQISIFTLKDWFLLVLLSSLTSLSLTMNIFVIRNELKNSLSTATVGRSSFSTLSGMLGSIFGPTASCASCVGSIFGFLGLGGVLLLLKYRQMILLLSIIIMLLTLYYTSKRVLGICNIKISRRR
ncbi:hypothetical protein A3A76_01255 [Candidatus Woesebacteria bacterium RIFCSPLOWO2_01_FULL_39_23]|uniref:Uncharacterized protein n=1 Tax=Candidatus Woesebacteria bacterium RIFCSPHIGHO2_01_FULL_40_22 TaxID=1802499 RepID=A0A1F7YGI9_9BACT|nr:MAG: hypothetical protein A2628_02850 [Candidatus Woesebacteria bacterium RIFCSPHIGHO2_01_FULL_40_22]OGM37623.1 MAG: hypothetical protein A3E41_05365 [Candidatus Woesebacteria bacterium RIFCSPHIGHO2_12_FULL_38_9]OGM62907.1 MAG: hypothetical protein A3A76_01255 [Candidatus Woesebacteria bacterium RIFCSPLOWO2_01_FULL_39_23]